MIEILIFTLGMLFWVSNIIGNIGWIRRKGKPSRPSSRKSSFFRCLTRVVAACVSITAFYFCDLRYVWLIIGAILFLGSLIGLPAIFVVHSIGTKWFDEPSDAVKTINVIGCVLAVFVNNILLVLWVYSWRFLFR